MLQRFLRQTLSKFKVGIIPTHRKETNDRDLTASILGVLACRLAFEAAISPDLLTEEILIPNTQDDQIANEPDKVAGSQTVYQGVFLPFPLKFVRTCKEKRDAN